MIGISLVKSGVSSTHWCTSNCQNFDWHLVGATTVQKRQSVLFHYAFVGLFFELVDAQFYASVEVLNELRIEQTCANIIRVRGQRVKELILLRKNFLNVKYVWKDFRLWLTLAGLLCNKCWEFGSFIIRIWFEQCAWSNFELVLLKFEKICW